MKLVLYSKISMVHAQATKLIMPNVSLHSPPSLSHSIPFCTAYLSIPFTSSKKADTCTDDVLLQTQSSNGEYNTEGAHMNKDVACTNRMHVQLDLARRKLHWASLTMDIQERQKSFQNTDFSETQKDSDEVSPLSEKACSVCSQRYSMDFSIPIA